MPDEVLNRVKEQKRSIESSESGISSKRPKLEEHLRYTETDGMKSDEKDCPIQIRCLNGGVVVLSKAASEELRRANYRVISSTF